MIFFIFSLSRPFPTYLGLKEVIIYIYILSFWIFFPIYKEFSITDRVGTHRKTIFLIFSLSRPFPTYFGLKRSYDGVFYFLNFFVIFIIGLVGTHQNDFFFPSFLVLLQPILAWKEAIIFFFNFLNYFAIFLEFSFPSRVETHRNFSLSQHFPSYFGLKRSYDGVF